MDLFHAFHAVEDEDFTRILVTTQGRPSGGSASTGIYSGGSGQQPTTYHAPVPEQQPRWVKSLWNADSVDPVMLRAPIVILVFIFLWGLNVYCFEYCRLPYTKVVGIKSASGGYICFYALGVLFLYCVIVSVLCSGIGVGIAPAIAVFYAFMVFVLSSRGARRDGHDPPFINVPFLYRLITLP